MKQLGGSTEGGEGERGHERGGVRDVKQGNRGKRGILKVMGGFGKLVEGGRVGWSAFKHAVVSPYYPGNADTQTYRAHLSPTLAHP